MVARKWYCKNCGHAQVVEGTDPPSLCTGCGASCVWQTDDDPKTPYVLSRSDRKFLRLQRITQDDEA